MRATSSILFLLVGLAAPALADDGDGVTQIKKSFEPNVAEVAAGTTLDFFNADDVTHSLIRVSPDGTQVDQGLQKPGETERITFPAPGAYSVICHIHPHMKIKVTVR